MFNVLIGLLVFSNPSYTASLLNNSSTHDRNLPVVASDEHDYYSPVDVQPIFNENFIKRSKPYLEEALRICPSIEFCSTKQDDLGKVSYGQPYSNNTSKRQTTPTMFDYYRDFWGNFTSFWNDTTFGYFSSTYNISIPATPTPSFEIFKNALQSIPTIDWVVSASELLSSHRSMSCCQQCSCSPDCLMTNNCCPDAQPKNNFSSSYTNCQSAYSEFSQQRFNITEVDQNTWPVLGYKIASQCPGGAHGCSHEQLDIINVTFDDVVLVSSNGKVYRNKYCAACDGVTNIQSWDLVATGCEDDLYSLSMTDSALVQYVLHNCIVYSVPPNDMDAEPFICHKHEDVIPTCNVTGLWDSYDVLLLRLCHVDTYLHYAYDEAGTTFNNIFCLMCNKPSGFRLPEMCTVKKRYMVPKRGPTFKLMLNREFYNVTASEAVADLSSRDSIICSDNMVYDPYLTYCRELFCPFQGFASNGLCYTQRQFTAINRIFDVGFKLHLAGPGVVRLSDFDVYRKEMFRMFLSEVFGSVNIEGMCEVVNASMVGIHSEGTQHFSHIVLRLLLKSSQSCDQDLIKRLLTHDYVTKSRFLLPFRGKWIKAAVEPLHFIELKNAFGNSSDEKLQQITEIYRQQSECTDCYIADIGRLFCPYLKLNKSEYCSLYAKLLPARMSVCPETPFDDKIVLDNTDDSGMTESAYYVCASDYKQLTVHQVQEQYQSGTSSMITILCVVVLLCCYLLI